MTLSDSSNTSTLCVSRSQVSPVTLSGSTEASGILRMMGVAFPGEREREEWEREQEEARKRDHRRIGKVRATSSASQCETRDSRSIWSTDTLHS